MNCTDELKERYHEDYVRLGKYVCRRRVLDTAIRLPAISRFFSKV